MKTGGKMKEKNVKNAVFHIFLGVELKFSETLLVCLKALFESFQMPFTDF